MVLGRPPDRGPGDLVDPTKASSVHRMEPAAAIAVFEQEAAAFADLLDVATMETPVPSCPGWTVAHLARHLGSVHRWAREAILVGPAPEPPGPDDPDQIEPWFREGAAELAATLRGCDPDQPCWTFGEPKSARFWLRRQTHETAMHCWDASTSLGVARDFDEALADDGIDEVVSMFVPRQVRLGRLARGPEVLELVSSSGLRTVLATETPQASPTSSITGPAEVLLLLLWRRTTLRDPRLTVVGSILDAERLLARPLTP